MSFVLYWATKPINGWMSSCFKAWLFLTGCHHCGWPESSQLLMWLLHLQWVQPCGRSHLQHVEIIAIAFSAISQKVVVVALWLAFPAVHCDCMCSCGIALQLLLANCSLHCDCLSWIAGYMALVFASYECIIAVTLATCMGCCIVIALADCGLFVVAFVSQRFILLSFWKFLSFIKKWQKLMKINADKVKIPQCFGTARPTLFLNLICSVPLTSANDNYGTRVLIRTGSDLFHSMEKW